MSSKTPTDNPTRVGALDTAGDVRREAARLYRAARRGDVDPKDASKLSCLLSLILRSLEVCDFERRLEKLEEQRQ